MHKQEKMEEPKIDYDNDPLALLILETLLKEILHSENEETSTIPS